MLNFLIGDGRMAKAINDHDWSGNPLGAPADWPAVLKITTATMLASHFPQALVWDLEAQIFLYNDAYAVIMGDKPDGIGEPFRDVWGEIWADISPIMERAFAGEASFNRDFPLTILRGPEPQEAWFTFCYSPVRDERGTIAGMLITVIETTDTVLAKNRIELLNHELAHRMKNTFSVIGAVSTQTFRAGCDPVEANHAFVKRLATLARAQDLVIGGEWGRAKLADIVHSSIAPLLPGPDALDLDGPPTELAGRQAHSLALALHELATNAAKYGALSEATGGISVRWSQGRRGSKEPFELVWEERGGPPVIPPERTGFGSRLVLRALPAEFRGSARLDYLPDGLRFTLRTEMDALE